MDANMNDAIVVKTTSGGILAIHKTAVKSVEATTYGGRNLACKINGIETEAGYDFVMDELGWKVKNFTGYYNLGEK